MGEWGKIKLIKMKYVWKPHMEAYYFIVKGLLGNLQTQATANSPQLTDLLPKTTATKRWKEKSLNMEKSVICPEPSPQLTSVRGTGRHSTHTTKGER